MTEGRVRTAEQSRVLVTWSSGHGATSDIAAAVTRRLQESSAGARVVSAVSSEQGPDPAGFDAVVLRTHPVWLFSSGPVGDPPIPADDSHDAEAVSRLVAARDPRLFPGRLDEHALGFGGRVLVTALRAPVGDSLNWAAVASWAEEIAAALSPHRTGFRP